MRRDAAEENDSLWVLVAPPSIWAAHFLISYATVAIWCAKVAPAGGALGGARIAVVVFSALALAGIAFFGWRGFVHHRLHAAPPPHDRDTPEDRHRFLGFATMLLAGLSAVAVIYASTVVVFVRSCR
jgi:hypothetical protein